MTIRVLRSRETQGNPDVALFPRKPDEGNLDWIARAIKKLKLPVGDGWSHLLLVGSNDLLSFRLRVAQSHVRTSLSPSAWSHIAFVHLVPPAQEVSVIEVSLAPIEGFGKSGFAPADNGIQSSHLGAYDDVSQFPNIAFVAMPVPAAKIEERLEEIKHMRSTFNVPELILRWLTYGWGVGVPSSPLADGYGIPGAAILEAAYAAEQFDLTPGLESRSSCPEAIWQAVRFWYRYQQDQATALSPSRRRTDVRICGAFCADNKLVPDDDAYINPPPAPKTPAPAKTRTPAKKTKPPKV